MSGHASPVTPTTGHTSRAKDPAIVAESQKPIGWVKNGFLILIICFVANMVYNTYQEALTQTKISAAEHSTRAATQPTSQSPTLMLRHECITPCSFPVNWRAQFWGDGHDLEVKHPGISEWILYKNGEATTAPEGVEVGETFFRSPNKENPHRKVKIFEKKGNWP